MRNLVVVVAVLYLFLSIVTSSCSRSIIKFLVENQNQKTVQVCGGHNNAEKNQY